MAFGLYLSAFVLFFSFPFLSVFLLDGSHSITLAGCELEVMPLPQVLGSQTRRIKQVHICLFYFGTGSCFTPHMDMLIIQ